MQSTYEGKINKYGELKEQIWKLWKIERIEIFSIILSSTDLIHKKLLPNLEILGVRKELFTKMQKVVLIKSWSIVREFLNP